MSRLDQITRCMDEVEKCVRDERLFPGLFGPMVGELDWLEELHYLLYNN
jgi:hypothetical protein